MPIKMTLEDVNEFIDIVDVPTKMHLLEYNDTETLERYRVLRTNVEDAIAEYEEQDKILHTLKSVRADILLVLQSKTYDDYLDKAPRYITADEYSRLKRWLKADEVSCE